MLIKDLKPISEKLYQAALDNQEATLDNEKLTPNSCLRSSFVWSETREGIYFWSAIDDKNFDTARRIDKENGWGLFESDDTEAVKETRKFKPGDKVVAVCDSVFDAYKEGDQLTVDSVNDVLGYFSDTTKKDILLLIENFRPAEEADKPVFIDWDPAEGVNKSAINDGLPANYVPPQAPRKAISFLYNDKQREEAERIDRARKRARFT